MESIFENIPEGVEIVLYADDILLLARGPFQASARKRLQKGIQAVANWANSIGLSLSSDKSQAMRLHLGRKLKPLKTKLTVGNDPIKFVRSLWILGVHNDTKLTFREQINRTKRRCE